MKRAAVICAALMSFSHSASAHAVVFPAASRPGAYEKYTLRVPNEKNSATIKIKIDFPDSLRVVSFADVAGWSLEVVKDSAQRIVGAIWTGTLPPQRFIELPFVGVNPRTGTTVTWPVHQTYADGETVDWTGTPESRTPASKTVIGSEGSSDNRLALWVSVAALAASLIALGMVLRPR